MTAHLEPADAQADDVERMEEVHVGTGRGRFPEAPDFPVNARPE